MGSGTATSGQLMLWALLLLLHTARTAAWTSGGYGEVLACLTDAVDPSGACAASEGELQVKLAGLVETNRARSDTISSAVDFATSTDFDFGAETYESVPSDSGSSSIVSRKYSAPVSWDNNAPSGSSSVISNALFSCVVSDYPVDVDPLTYPAGSIKIEFSIEGWQATYADDRLELSLYVNQLIDGISSGQLAFEYKTDTVRVFVGSEAFVELPMTILETAGGPPVPVGVSFETDLLRISLPATEMVSYSFLFVRSPLSTTLDSPLLAPFSRTWISPDSGVISTCSEPVNEHCPGGLTVNLLLDALGERDADGVSTGNEVTGFSGSPAFAFTDTESVDLMSADGVTYRTMTWWSFMAAIPQYGGSTSPYAPVSDPSNGDPTFSCKVNEYSEDMDVTDFPAGSLEITCSVSGWSFLNTANRLVLTMSVTVTSDTTPTDPEALYETDLSPDLVRLHLGSPEAFLDLQLTSYDNQNLVELDAIAKVVSVSAGYAKVEVSLPDASDQSYTFMLVRPPLSLEGTASDAGSGSFSAGTTWTPTWVTDPYQSGSVQTWFKPVEVGTWDTANISLSLVNLWEVTDMNKYMPVSSVSDFNMGPYVFSEATSWEVVAADGMSISTVGSRSIFASIPNDGMRSPYAADMLSGDPQMTFTVTDYPSDLDVFSYPAGSLEFEYTFQNWTFQNLTSTWLVFHFAVSVDTTYELALTELETSSELRVQLGVESFLDLPKYGIDLETGLQVQAQVHLLNKETGYTQMRVLLPASSSGVYYKFTLARPPLSLQSTGSGSAMPWTPTWETNSNNDGSVITCSEPVDNQCADNFDIALYLRNLKELEADGVTEVVSVLGFSEGPFVFYDDENWNAPAADGMTMSTIGYRYFDASIPDNGTAPPYSDGLSGSDPIMACMVTDYPSDLDVASYPAGSLQFEYQFQNWGFRDPMNNWLEFSFAVAVPTTTDLVLVKADEWSNWKLQVGANAFLDLPMTADDWATGEPVVVNVSLVNVDGDYPEVRVLLPASTSGHVYRFTLARPPLSLQSTDFGSSMSSSGASWKPTWVTDPYDHGTVSTCFEPIDGECTEYGDISWSLVGLEEVAADKMTTVASVLGFSEGPYVFYDAGTWDVLAEDGMTMRTIGYRRFETTIPNNGTATPYPYDGSTGNPWMRCFVSDYPAGLNYMYTPGSLSLRCSFENWQFQDVANNWLAFTFSISVNTTYELALAESVTENGLRVQLGETSFLDLPWSAYDEELGEQVTPQVSILDQSNGYAQVRVLLPATYDVAAYESFIVRPPHSLIDVVSSGSYSMGYPPTTTLAPMWWSEGSGSVHTCLYLWNNECSGGIVSFYLDSLVERSPYGIVSGASELYQTSAFEFGEVTSLSVLGDDDWTTTTIPSRTFSAGIPQDGITEPFALYMGEYSPYPTFTCTVEEFPTTLDPDQFPAGSMTFSYMFENWAFSDRETNYLAFTFTFKTDAYIKFEETDDMLLLYLDADVQLKLPKTCHGLEDGSIHDTEVEVVSYDPNGFVQLQVNLPAISVTLYTFQLMRPSLISPKNTPTPAPTVDTESPPRSELHFFPGGFELCSAAACNPGVNSMLSVTLDRLGVGNQLTGPKSSSSSSSSSSFSEAVGMDFLMEISDFKMVDNLLFTRDPVYIDTEDPYYLLLLQIPRVGGEVVVYDDLESFLEMSGLTDGTETLGRASPAYMVLAVTHVQANETASSGETNRTEADAPKGSAKMRLFLFNANNGTAFSDDTETFSFFLSGFQRGTMLTHVNIIEKANATRVAFSSDTGVAVNAQEEVYLDCPNHANVDGIPTSVKEVDAVVYSSGEYAGLIQFWIRVPGIQTSMEFEYQCVLVATDSSTTSAVGASPSGSGSDAWDPPTMSRDGRPRSTKMQIGSRGEFGLCFDPSCAEGSPAVSVGFSGLGSRLGIKLPRFEGAAAFAFRDPTHVTDSETERWSTSFQAIVPQSRLQAPRAFTTGSSPPAKGEGALFSVGVDQYLTPGQASNGDQIVDVPRGGLKFVVNISGWEFGGLDDALELNFTLSAASLFPNSSSGSGAKLNVSQEDVATDANITRVWLGDNTQPFLDVPIVAEVDGVMTRVNVSVSVDDENLDVIFAMTFPSFAETLYYDPVLASQALVNEDVKVTYVNHRRKAGRQFQLSQTAGIPLFVALVLVVVASVLHCFQTAPLSIESPKEKP